MNRKDDENYDPAHEHDMAMLRREQLRADIEDWELVEPENFDLGHEDYDPEQYDFEEDWEELSE